MTTETANMFMTEKMATELKTINETLFLAAETYNKEVMPHGTYYTGLPVVLVNQIQKITHRNKYDN